jgi:hypothetical protein
MSKSPSVLKCKIGEAVDVLAADKMHAEDLRGFSYWKNHAADWKEEINLTTAFAKHIQVVFKDMDITAMMKSFNDGITVPNKVADYSTKFLSDFISVELNQPKCNFLEISECQREIRSFKALLKKRYAHLKHGLSEIEKRHVQAIEQAIDFFETTNSLNFYVKFKSAVNIYTIWFNQRLYKFELYLIHLLKKLIATGIVFDFRERLRGIMRFLFKNLDDEDTINNKIRHQLAQLFYCLKYKYHESGKYSISN